MKKRFSNLKIVADWEIILTDSEKDMQKAIMSDSDDHRIGFINDGQWGYISLREPETKLTYEVLQRFLDSYLEKNSSVSIDYIHGEHAVFELGGKRGTLGLYLTAIKKAEFFQMIIDCGSLPRKTFSIGEAQEKRYYIESRKITFD